MKFTCRQSILGETLSVISKIPLPKTNLEVLKGTLLEVKDGELIFHRTNLDTAITKTIPVKNSKDGKVVIDTMKVTQYIQSLSEKNEVTFDVKEGGVEVSSEQGSVTFNILDSDDFPEIQKVALESDVEIDVEVLNKGIQSTVFACAKSAIRPEFASVYVYQKKDTKEICFVATDSFRLSEYTKGYEFNEFKSFLIPAPVAQNLVKVTASFEGEVSLGYGDGQLVVRKDGYTVISRLTDAVFPDYSRIIPVDFQYHIQVFKKDLISIFRQVQIFNDVYNQVVLSIKKDSLTLTSHNQQGEGGVHVVTAVLEKVGGGSEEQIDLKFNYMYFLEALQHVATETVTVLVSGAQKPLLLKDDNGSYMALVMPMSK